MANNAISPRQKMIGMMYLVLTALLALQVDNTLLDQFIRIDESLQSSLSKQQNDNQATLKGIRNSVNQRGNAEDGLAVLQKAQQVNQATQATIQKIEAMREKIIDITGGTDEEGNLVGGQDVDQVMAYALGPGDSKNGEAYTLKDQLAQYVSQLNDLFPEAVIAPIALDANEINYYKGTDQANKDFATLNFQNTPTVAALAVLSQIAAKVADAEATALQKLAIQVGAKELPIDKITAKVSPESKVVTAGMPYRARMFVAASSSVANPVMQANTGEIKVGPDGEGVLEFVASAGNYDENGLAKKVWKGAITLKTPKGDTTFQVEEEYFVARPAIRFESAAIQALYKNCGNELNVQIPGIASGNSPRFTASGGQLINRGGYGQITLVPTSSNMVVTVRLNGTVLGTEKFRVKPVPRPSLKVMDGSRNVLDEKRGGRAPSRITVAAVADADFARYLPNDSKYRITRWELALARGASTPYGRKSYTSGRANIRDIAEKARSGDRLVIEIKEVKRVNYLGQEEKVPLGNEKYFFYPITR